MENEGNTALTEAAERVKRVFGSKRELLALTCPRGREYLEAWHATQAGFGVRVMPADRDGRVRRTYLCRYTALVPDGKGGFKKKDRKERLGLVEALGDEPAISYDDAHEAVLKKRRTLREKKAAPDAARFTVKDAWDNYATEKGLNRETTLEKDSKTYNRFLAHLGDRFLDELPYQFWTSYLNQLKSGKLEVGRLIQADGEDLPDLRGLTAKASLLAVFNVASNLYEIAHKYKALKGLTAGENPAREAKKLIGKPNKRRNHIPLKQLAEAWAASDQLTAPHWRDLFRVCVLTGLRNALLYSMRFDEVDFANKLLLIDPRKPGTKRRGKDIPENPEPLKLPLGQTVLEILKARLRYAPDPKGAVWYAPPTGRGKRAGNGVLVAQRTGWKPIEAAVGRHFSPHDLRRTYANLGLRATGKSGILPVSLLMLHSGSTLAQAVGLPAITVDYMNTEEAQDLMRSAVDEIDSYAQQLVQERAEAPDDLDTLPGGLETALDKD